MYFESKERRGGSHEDPDAVANFGISHSQAWPEPKPGGKGSDRSQNQEAEQMPEALSKTERRTKHDKTKKMVTGR